MDKASLHRIPFFSGLPAAEIDLLATELSETRYPLDTILFREGDEGDIFYIVLEGEINILKALGTPGERQLATRGPGEYIGEMSLFSRGGLRTASARVRAGSRLLALSHADLEALLRRVPGLARELLRVLSDRLNQAHNVTIRDLTEKNRQLTEAYAILEAAQEQIAEKMALERELMQASEIQASMLPQHLPGLAGFEIGARMLPARMVGGDFFDIFPLGEGKLGIAVGDVSGKGMPAALFMALTSSLLRAEARRGAAPEKVLRHLNQHLLDRNEQGMFVTILYGILDRADGTFNYVRAGHEPPLVWDARGRIKPESIGGGQLLGFMAHPVLETITLTLPAGSTMMLYSDGVTEAMDERGELFGLERLHSCIPALLGKSAQEECDSLVETLTEYHGAAAQADDITLLAIKARA